MGWLITLGVLVLLAVLPLGVRLRYDAEGFRAAVAVGPLRIPVYPLPKKKPKKKKEAPKKQENQSENLPKPPQPPKTDKDGKGTSGGSLLDFLPLVKLALALLEDLRRKLRVPRLEVRLVLGGDDPADLAVNYGRACAAVANLIPTLERFLVIQKRDIQVACDFTAAGTLVTAWVEVTITLGRLLLLAVVYGIRVIREFLQIKKKRKGGAVA